MIYIKIPSNYIEERTYSAKVVFGVLLGLNYEIETTPSCFTVVSWDNKSISFFDDFWNEGGISIDNLPKVNYARLDFTPESDIPILYGHNYLKKSQNKIECGIDVLASVFFMLTRWEEYVKKSRDEYSRFRGVDSIAYKNGYIHRPIVNEYVEMVWNMMQYLGYKGNRKSRTFKIVPTHDVDLPFMRNKFNIVTKLFIKSILKGDLKSAVIYITNYIIDPFDTFNFLMDVSEQIGVKSHFYFMSSDEGIIEYNNSPYMTRRYKKIAYDIKKRGHILGFHPGYFTIEKEEFWMKEKKLLSDFLSFVPEEGRQHYLRFKMPETFSFWENGDMKIDSTLCYPDVEGFRCGTGDSFPVYNFLEKKEYKLKERPLIIMDGTLIEYRGYTIEKARDVLNYYIAIGKKYEMPITLLFHNSSFKGYAGKMLKKIYRDCLIKSKCYE